MRTTLCWMSPFFVCFSLPPLSSTTWERLPNFRTCVRLRLRLKLYLAKEFVMTRSLNPRIVLLLAYDCYSRLVEILRAARSIQFPATAYLARCGRPSSYPLALLLTTYQRCCHCLGLPPSPRFLLARALVRATTYFATRANRYVRPFKDIFFIHTCSSKRILT